LKRGKGDGLWKGKRILSHHKEEIERKGNLEKKIEEGKRREREERGETPRSVCNHQKGSQEHFHQSPLGGYETGKREGWKGSILKLNSTQLDSASEEKNEIR